MDNKHFNAIKVDTGLNGNKYHKGDAKLGN